MFAGKKSYIQFCELRILSLSAFLYLLVVKSFRAFYSNHIDWRMGCWKCMYLLSYLLPMTFNYGNAHNIVNKSFSSSNVGLLPIIFGHRGGPWSQC